MRQSKRSLFSLAVLAGLTPVGIGFASAMVHRSANLSMLAQQRLATDTACASPFLASPATQEPDSADYYLDQNVVVATTSGVVDLVHVHLGAYAPLGDNDGIPEVVGVKVLDGQYRTLPDDPLLGGHWAVSNSCGNRSTHAGDTSHLYYFEGTWTAPSTPGTYELETTFRFVDFRLISYLVNMQVVAPPLRGQPLPRLSSHIHDTVSLDGLGVQNIANHAYDLDALPPSLHVTSTYLFQGDPAWRSGVSKIASGMLNGIIDNRSIFANVDRSASGAHGNGEDDRIVLPCSMCGEPAIRSFHYPQAGAGVQSGNVTVGIPPSAVPVGDGQHFYTHEAIVDEPLTVCTSPNELCDNEQSTTFALKVGSYVIDNGFFGPIEDGHGSYAENFGDGDGFVFYANPGTPRIDSATPADNGALTIRVSWPPVNPSATDANTQVFYDLQLIDAARLPPGEQPDVIATTTTNPFADVRVPGPATYSVRLVARFVIDNVSGTTLTIDSDPRISRFVLGAPVVAPTSMPTPMPTRTSTVTPVPPTATLTPTPTAARAAITVRQTVVPYAWLRTSSVGSPDRPNQLSPTTTGTDPAHIFWPVGRPMHILPTVSEQAQDTSLLIRELGSGVVARVYARSVTTISYAVQYAGINAATSCGQSADAPAPIAYVHDSHYPQEVSPFSDPVTIIWAPLTGARSMQPVTWRCGVAALLPAGASSTLALRYRVRQAMTFDLLFGSVNAPNTCDANLVPAPTARPYAPEPSLTPPTAAFATPGSIPERPCPAGRVSLAAVEYAIAHARTQLRLADTRGNAAITGVSARVDPRGAGNLNELGITLDVDRTLQVAYTLTFLRNVP